MGGGGSEEVDNAGTVLAVSAHSALLHDDESVFGEDEGLSGGCGKSARRVVLRGSLRRF